MPRLIFALAVVASVALHAQSLTYTRGEQVRITSFDPDHPATTMRLTVVGLPDDRLSVDGKTVYVNSMPVTTFSPAFLARVAAAPERIPSRVPEGHYFVMGEQQVNQNISEYWGQHAAISLQPAQ